MNPIVIYGTAWCGDCMRAKRILQQFRVPFAWIDIEEDEKAAEFVETTSHGMQSVPVIVFGDGSLPYRLAQLFAYPAYVLLLVGCGWSAWRMRGRPELANRFAGTLLIAIGATIVAIGSGVGAGLDVVPLFTIGLALGIAVMFAGFLRAARPTPARPS